MIAIRAGRLFDSRAGQLLTNQVVLHGERITEVGPAAEVSIPADARVIDLVARDAAAGAHRRAHAHLQQPKAGITREIATMIAIQNAQANLRAGFTALARHEQPRQRLCRRRCEERVRQGPDRRTAHASLDARHRLAGAGQREPNNPLAARVVRTPEEARAAVRDQIENGADWIKLFPGGRLFVHAVRRAATM